MEIRLKMQTRLETKQPTILLIFTSLHLPGPFIDNSLFQMASPSVSEAQNLTLTSIPYPKEIRNVVFKLKRLSSPGPNGFPGVFFTNT